jgi:hypothetical protein
MKHVYNPLIRITLSIAPITRFLNVSLFYSLPTENLHRPGLEPGLEITSVRLPCCCVLFSDSLCSFQIGFSRYVTIWKDITAKNEGFINTNSEKKTRTRSHFFKIYHCYWSEMRLPKRLYEGKESFLRNKDIATQKPFFFNRGPTAPCRFGLCNWRQ